MAIEQVSEGRASYHAYELRNIDGELITMVEHLQYKVSDGAKVLLPWTKVNTPAGSGTIIIPGTVNRLINSYDFSEDTVVSG